MLCLEHHSDVTGNQGLGRNYTPQEVSLYKEGWEGQCTTWHENSEEKTEEEEESVEPTQTFTKRVTIVGDEHYFREFELEKGDEITFSVSNDEPIDFMIMTKRQYNRWIRDGECNLYFEESDITSLEDSFEVPKEGTWFVVFCNESEDDVTVDFDVAIWPAE